VAGTVSFLAVGYKGAGRTCFVLIPNLYEFCPLYRAVAIEPDVIGLSAKE
jgi:hypothetical protein